MARHQITKDRVGVNKEVKTTRGRGIDGKYTRLYKGNYKNSSEMPKSQKAQKFGTHTQKWRDIRAAFGMSTG